MKGIGKIIKNINTKKLVRYLFPSFLLFALLILMGTVNFTQARYESEVDVSGSPNLAFFIVDVTTQSGHIKLDEMIPRTEPYTYTFNVSNFNNQKRANVDLTYTIEIITTTNMPLNFQIFKGNDMNTMQIDHDTTSTDVNGVYYRHLVIDDASIMTYNTNHTDTYTLWVQFPIANKDYPERYEGIIDLIDIKIVAEQVV
jgi:hypothetical protein